jgi:hypothetical protein
VVDVVWPERGRAESESLAAFTFFTATSELH